MYKKNYKAKSAEERRKEVQDAVKEIHDGVKEFLNSDQYREVLINVAKFHYYSFNNAILILMQNPNATYVASYQTWKRDFNRQVEKGEKGMKILVPIIYKHTEDKIDPKTNEVILDKDGKPVKEVLGQQLVAFKLGHVFDVEQTKQIEGKPEVKISLGVDELKGTVENYDVFMKSLEEAAPVPVKFEEIDGGAKGYYSPVENRIAIKKDMSELQTVKTLIHESSHALLHNKERIKKLKEEGVTLTTQDMETEAESTAFVVASYYGLDTSEYSFPYVASWAGNEQVVKQNLEPIRYAANTIIEKVDKNLEKYMNQQKEEGQSIELNEPEQEEEEEMER